MGKVKIIKHTPVRKTLPSKRSIIRAPRSTWIYFLQHVREKNQLENKNLSFGELCKRMSPKWRDMTPEERKPYTASYIKDKQRYQQDLTNLTDEHRKILRTYKRMRRKNRIGRPKAAMSTYMLFVMVERPRVVAEHPDISFQEIGRELGKRWRCIDPELFLTFQKKSQVDRDRFSQELKVWNEIKK